MDSLVGATLDGRYRVIRLLGTGGMGAVYEAEQLRLSRRVAVKTIHAHLATKSVVVERFRREAMAAAASGSKHIVEVYDLGQLPNGAPYMVMEHLDGENVAELLGREGAASTELAIEIVRQACDALGSAHDAGIVHRDIKSENIMVVSRRGKPFVKVVDFGISKLRDSSLTGSSELLGTPYAMAPEQLRASKEVDARADVYSLGVVLYHMLSGRLPFDADTLPMLIAQISTGEMTPLRDARSGLPDTLYAIVETAMAFEPEKRFQSMDALERALESMQGSSIGFEPTMEAPVQPPVDEPSIVEPSVVEVHTPHEVSPRPATPDIAAVDEEPHPSKSRVLEVAFIAVLALAMVLGWLFARS